jgi:PAS domain S-box-containing protein
MSTLAGFREMVAALERAEDGPAVVRAAAEGAAALGAGGAAGWSVQDGVVERVAASGVLAGLRSPPRVSGEALGGGEEGPPVRGLMARECGPPGRRDGILAFVPPDPAPPDWADLVDLVADLASAALRRVERTREAAVAAERMASERVRTRALIEQSPLIIALRMGPDHVLEMANARYLEMVGRNRDVLGRSGRESLPEVASQGFFDVLDRVYATGEPFVGKEVRARYARGPEHTHEGWYDYTWQPIRDSHGRVVGTAMHAVDVTDHVQARLEAEAVRSRFRDLVHSIDAVVWEADLNATCFNFVSEWAERVLGYPIRQWYEPGFWESILHPEDAPRILATSQDAMRAGDDHELQYRVLARDGRVVWLHDVVRVLRDNDGVPTGVRGVMVDITARMEAERERDRVNAQLLHSQKLESLGLLASGAAHDFNNLLAVILGNASLALLRAGDTSVLARPLADIIAAARRAEDLTRQLLAYAGKAPFRLERVDISAQVRQIVGLLESTVPKKVTLELRLAEDLPLVCADPTQIQQVTMNLVMNAAEAVGDRAGRVLVTTRVGWYGDGGDLDNPGLPPGLYTVLEVRDTGAGMTAEVQARILDPFFSTKGVGRGLGLSAVDGIVRAHDGLVRFDSVPGAGTRCTVYLPATEGGRVPAPVEPPRLGMGHGHILVVDDEEDVRSTARLMLEYLGYTVVEAEDGQVALDLLAATPHLVSGVLLDVTMPVMDGEEVFAAIREILPDLPVVLSSGYNEGVSMARLRERGPVSFLQKPYTIQELGAAMRRVGCG